MKRVINDILVIVGIAGIVTSTWVMLEQKIAGKAITTKTDSIMALFITVLLYIIFNLWRNQKDTENKGGY